MNDQTEMINEIFKKLQEVVTEIASLSQLNAMLSSSDPGLILPSPALGLIELKSNRSISIADRTKIIPIDGYTVGEEVIFCPLVSDVTVHPWYVDNAEWITTAKGESGLNNQSKGIRIKLKRDSNSTINEGWLNLAILNNIPASRGLHRARIYAGNFRLESRRCPLSTNIKNFPYKENRSVIFNMNEINSNLIQIKLSLHLTKQTELMLDLYFDQPILLNSLTDSPNVLVNIFPIWNSLECEYPDISDIEQRLSESRNKLIHPLNNHRMGKHWKAWFVKDVYCTNPLRNSTMGSANALLAGGENEEKFDHALMIIPTAETGNLSIYRSSSAITLAIAISPKARLYLDTRSSQLRAIYSLTMGSYANGISPETRFTLENPETNVEFENVSANLIGTTWGGSDGFGHSLNECNSKPDIHSLLIDSPRTINDLCSTIDKFYGEHIRIIDPYDLIRQSSDLHCEPLYVKIEFTGQPFNLVEKKSILSSCESFINLYLQAHNSGPVILIEEDSYEH